MITGVIKNKIDKIWEDIWAGGLTMPFKVIEQITYLMFIRKLDEKEIDNEKRANSLRRRNPNAKVEMIFPQTASGQGMRWSNFKTADPEVIFNTIRIKVQIPNLSSKFNISTYILAMGRNVDFDLKLDQSTLKFISSNEEAKLPENNNNNVVNNIVSGDSNVSESINNSNNLVGNNISKKGKLYNIKNEIIHDNETGKAMARKYLNETSKIEEIDGELYLTLTFTGVDLMQNHKFYVNGNLVKYEVTSSSSSSKSYRFKINSLSDDIKVNVYIVPMNTTVEFGVKLLENTYTFVKDFEVLDRKLPQTGGLINNETLFINGSLIIALGAFIGRRKRK